MNVKEKFHPSLMWKIWGMFVLVIVVSGVFMLITVRSSITSFIDEQVYQTLADADYYMGNPNFGMTEDNPIVYDRKQQQSRSVNQLIFLANGQILYGSAPRDLVNQVYQEALTQDEQIRTYQSSIDGEDVYYIIRRNVSTNGNLFYQVSYAWDSYRQDLISALFLKLSAVIGFVILLSLGPALWLSRRLTTPLIEMESAVGKIVNRQWETPLPLGRKDEIGQLAESIDAMRKELNAQNQAQQALLQNISHDLKTPIMVIRGYAQSIADGIYPTGDVTGSARVIDEEASRLEKKVVDLLYVTKLEYFKEREPKTEIINVDRLIDLLVERLRLRKPVAWTVEGSAGEMLGDPEQIRVAFENVLDNSLRYAQTGIEVRLAHDDTEITVEIENDGPAIDDQLEVFHQFSRGKEGKFGLGLFIVQQVVTLHNGRVELGNTNKGVVTKFHFPVSKQERN